jgi:hypothetical protein
MRQSVMVLGNRILFMVVILVPAAMGKNKRRPLSGTSLFVVIRFVNFLKVDKSAIIG